MLYFIPKSSLQACIKSGDASADETAGMLALQCVIQGFMLDDFVIVSEANHNRTRKIVDCARRLQVAAQALLSIQERLTKREIEILKLLVMGLPNKVIGDRINLSERTVKFHVSSLLKKYHVQSRTELMQRLHMMGSLDPEKKLTVVPTNLARADINRAAGAALRAS